MASHTRSRAGRTTLDRMPEHHGVAADDQIDDGRTEETRPTATAQFVAEDTELRDGHEAVASEGTPGVTGTPGVDDGRDGVSAAQGDLEPVPGYEARFLNVLAQESRRMVADGPPLLDAWYASFEASAALQQPEVVERIAEVVIGVDDRIQITATTSIPWRWICALRIKAKDGSNWIGTGWLVGPRTVITAGHCVYIHDRGGWVSSIEVIPGCNGATRPYGSGTATAFRSVTGWTSSRNRNYDYGAMILPSHKAYGNQLGYFGYASLSESSLLNLTLNLSGYPGDKPSGTQWFHARKTASVTARTIVYNIDTAGGQSGSPVWRYLNGQRHAVGIHTNGSPSGNSATRIVTEVFNNIKKWKEEGM